MRGPLLGSILRRMGNEVYVAVVHDAENKSRILDWMLQRDENAIRDMGRVMLEQIEADRRCVELPVITPLIKRARECKKLRLTILKVEKIAELDPEGGGG